MPVTTLTCPGCKIILKPTKPVPEGKKVKCPKCSTIFVGASTSPGPSNGAQAKERPELKEETAADEGWEVVEDDDAGAAEKEAPKVVEAFKLSDSDTEKKPPKLTYTNEPKVKTKKTRKPVQHDEDDEDELEDDVEQKPRPKKARKPVPQDEDEDEDELDDIEEEDDEDEEEDLRPRRSLKRRGKRSDSGGRVVLMMLVIVGVSLLVVGTGIGIGTYWFLNRDRNRGPDDELLAYVPADASFIVGIDFASLRGAAPTFAAQFEESIKQDAAFLRDCKKHTGYDFLDLFEYGVMAGKPPVLEGNARRGPLKTTILKARVPFNPNHFRDAAQGSATIKHNGKTFFRMTEPGATMLYMPSNRLLILSNQNEVEMQTLVGLDGVNPAMPAETVSSVRSTRQNHNFWFLGALDTTQKRQYQALGAALGAFPDVKSILNQVTAARAIELALNIQSGTSNARLRFICPDSASASRLAKDGSTIFDKYFKGLGAVWLTAVLAGKSEDLRAAVKELINGVRFSSQGNTAEVTVALSSKSAEVLMKEGGARPSMLD